MKKTVLILILSLAFISSFSQAFENSWINYNQQYFKIKVWSDGIYRINQQTLLFAGIPLSSIDPRKIQVFHEGVEQYIYIEGEGDGNFGSGDYIEFYGERNTGHLDTRLYADTTWQPNRNYSLFTDTAVYFLTWSTVTNGKRMIPVNTNNYSAYSPAGYFTANSYVEQTSGYNRGINDKNIEYVESEGWSGVFGNYYGGNFPLTIQVSTANSYSGGPDAEITTAVGGVNNLPHYTTITFPGTNFSDVYYAQSLRNYSFTTPVSNFSSATTNFLYNVTTPVSTSDYSSFYWLSVKYPHTPALENRNTFRMLVQDDPQGKARYDFSNFNGGSNPPVLYDLTNHKRILVTVTGNTYQTLIDNDGNPEPKTCYISAETAITNITAIAGINYVTNNFGFFNNLQLAARDSAYIIVTSKALWNQALAYKNYRDITTNNKVVLIDIMELCDQFAWGIAKHPLAIKNFIHYTLNAWTGVSPPQDLFLLGKSISPADFRTSPSLFEQCLVPSFGVPTSDMLLVSGIDGSLYEPKVPVGRLSAKTGTEVSDYLQKVQEYETAQNGVPQPWMKEILHFGGGINPTQQAELAGYLDNFKAIMEDSAFGGHVTTYLKYNTNPITINQSDSLQNQIDSGVAIMTFFGHASGSGFDQSTDEPSAYNNQGKYPLVIANSCFAGDIHTSQVSVSEKFVLEPEKAAIGFIASVGQGIPTDLDNYSGALFREASYYSYGASVGTLMQRAIERIQIPNAENIKIVCNEMSLHGDPAIKLNSFTKPDFAVSETGIHFSPSRITTDLDTFHLDVRIRNFGKAVADSFNVKITRTFPNGVDSVLTVREGNCFYANTISLTLNTGGFNAAGLNHIKVEVDLPDSIDEYDNFINNTASTDIFITSKDIIPVYPAKYAIYPYNTVTLKASTSDPLAGVRNYKFEIDTVDLSVSDSLLGFYRSPEFRFTTLSDSGGVLSWAPPMTLHDSTVYYWRVANDSIDYDPVTFTWQESSFMYIAGKTGWAQSGFYQYKNDTYENLRYDTIQRRFDFVLNNKALLARTYGQPDGSQNGYNEIGYFMNNAPIEYNGCTANPAVMIAVLDSISLDPWTNCAYNFGQANTFTVTSGSCGSANVIGTGNCRQRPENYFIYQFGNNAQIQSIPNMINQVPDGDYILAYSWYTTNYSTVNPSFESAFSGLGFNMLLLQDGMPFLFFMKKGDPSSIIQYQGNSPGDTLVLQTLLSSVWNRGFVTSPVIGPSTRWESLHWNQVPSENPSSDQKYVNLLGLNSTTNAWDTVINQLSWSVTGKDTTLGWLNATQYPYLRIQGYTQDDAARTPSQFKYWRIYYDEVPECAVNPNRTFSFYKDPLQEGDTLRMSIAIDNIGNLPMDSLDVNFFLYDNNRQRHDLKNFRLDSLRVNQSLLASLVVDSTLGFSGTNSLWVEANPYDAHHQLEQNHFNNYAEVRFQIDGDKTNPILDVTFDGIHILDGDIISGKPHIAIQVKDENRFLAMNDSSDIKMYISGPGYPSSTLLNYGVPYFGKQIQFSPAVLPKNNCRVDWEPVFSQDGIYTLEVEATDKSKNESGKYNYRISFEVINRSTITEVLNYPNPFSTSTRFVFTLTGNEIPDHMKIQIMTVTGKIVREIMLDELGNIHIGRNITDYAWDGRDEYGDQLANGLYLYRVVTDLHGEKIEHRETDADKYFKKGWGKMYLMR